MSTRIETDTNGDVVLAFVNREHDDTYEASIFIGHDGVTVVQIDTPADAGRVRINLNDGPIYDGDPDTDDAPGSELAPLRGITLTREQLEAWAGVHLTDDEVDRLAQCIPNSSIPDAIGIIVCDALGIDAQKD
jgi:hypothetical protein